MQGQELRRRPAAAAEADTSAADETDESVDPARPWHASIMVRVILAALGFFALIHLFLWKVVYDFAVSTNQERLRNTMRDVVDSLYVFVDHL